ncbi:GPW/gp25 family protein [Nannocystaceae bacterium ST9]
MSFPLRFDEQGPRLSDRSRHVREQIEQVLFTDPGERVFRPSFGAGLRSLVFEPSGSAIWSVIQKRLMSALIDALQGEVDPRTLRIEILTDEADAGAVVIDIRYTLAAVGVDERHRFTLAGPGGKGG